MLHLMKISSSTVEETERIKTNVGTRAIGAKVEESARLSDQPFVEQSVHVTVFLLRYEETFGHERRWKAYINEAMPMTLSSAVGARTEHASRRDTNDDVEAERLCDDEMEAEDAGSLFCRKKKVRFSSDTGADEMLLQSHREKTVYIGTGPPETRSTAPSVERSSRRTQARDTVQLESADDRRRAQPDA